MARKADKLPRRFNGGRDPQTATATRVAAPLKWLLREERSTRATRLSVPSPWSPGEASEDTQTATVVLQCRQDSGWGAYRERAAGGAIPMGTNHSDPTLCTGFLRQVRQVTVTGTVSTGAEQVGEEPRPADVDHLRT